MMKMNIMIKHKLITRHIFDELKAAKVKHPDYLKDLIHAAAIIAEETGELVRAAIDFEYSNLLYKKSQIKKVKDEAIQTAAMCVRLLENLE